MDEWFGSIVERITMMYFTTARKLSILYGWCLVCWMWILSPPLCHFCHRTLETKSCSLAIAMAVWVARCAPLDLCVYYAFVISVEKHCKTHKLHLKISQTQGILHHLLPRFLRILYYDDAVLCIRLCHIQPERNSNWKLTNFHLICRLTYGRDTIFHAHFLWTYWFSCGMWEYCKGFSRVRFIFRACHN